MDRKSKLRKPVLNELKLTNRFHSLQDKNIAEYTEVEEDEDMFDNLFTIGSRNIFNLRRSRMFLKIKKRKVSKQSFDKTSSSIDEISFDERKSSILDCFQTFNRFEPLCDNPEEDIEKLIKTSYILSANKKSVKKCRTCHFKKRQCALSPSLCRAIDKVCNCCKKIGHFPKSLCCKKRRKYQNKNIAKMRSNGSFTQVISKKNLKLIKTRIQQLERHKKRNCIIQSADKCAVKFENAKFDQDSHMMIDYCAKKLKKQLKIKSLPDTENKAVLQNMMNVFDQMYYNTDDCKINSSSNISKEISSFKNDDLNTFSTDTNAKKKGPVSEEITTILQLDGNISLSSEDETVITQIDGNDSMLIKDEAKMKRTIFSINCASNDVIQLITFFRSFDFVWEITNWHKLCNSKSSEESCFFCHVRSSCLRLNGKRGRGPKGLKINEFASQLDKYKSFLGWDWIVHSSDIPAFIRNTISMLKISESQISSLFGLDDEMCRICKKQPSSPSALVYQVDISILQKRKTNINVNALLNYLIKNSSVNECCMQTKLLKSSRMRCIIMELSSPVSINITDSEVFEGKKILINSFVTQEQNQGEMTYQSTFFQGNTAYFQNPEGDIIESGLTNRRIKVISILIPGKEERVLGHKFEWT